ncbi:unnamed protein product [Adineta ricciae]|uniref:RRM domain-containing protein n=1 Tax=Adineta ricciae TaxID=249248 RepID=A0A815X2I2_ADIRI|nr:unnamed protein product [Adineta ricciae]
MSDRDVTCAQQTNSHSRSAQRSRASPLSSASTRNLTEHGKSAGPEPNSILGIFGLSPRTTENDLREAFGRFGQVKDVQIIMDKKTSKSRGFGFVYYDTIEEATRAKESMRLIKFDGRTVRIDFSVTKCAHEPTPGVYMGQPIRRISDRSATIGRRSDHYGRKHFRSRSRSRSSSRRRDHHRHAVREPYRTRDRN